jgi:hypothetical protein
LNNVSIDGTVSPALLALSAVVVFGEQREREERCLRHLLAQTVLDRMEIVIVDLSRDPVRMPGWDQPPVRWYHRPDLENFGAARAECVRQSRGGIVAFLEDHCYADSRWAEKILEAFERPIDLVNYAMTNANPQLLLGRTFLMVEYGRWLDPARSGYISIAACNNVAYRRTALEPYWDRLDDLFEAEYVLHREMQAAGSRAWLAGEAKLAHQNWTRLWDGVQANNDLKRLLAARQAKERRWGGMTRLAWALGMAVTPPLHIARLARSLTRRPALWPLFWASVPLMVLVYTCGAWAEAMGYLFGDGDCQERFRDLEISIARED